ncbi:MAG: winged helix-turn-helix domain-containing protein [Myxococcales bacterium]|nr:winged helix-turn-helix domain-containing protein [Myxococcales bacterium]
MGEDFLNLGTCVVHLDARRIERSGEAIGITSQEAALLAHLAAHTGATVTREVLFREVLGYVDGSNSRALDAAVRRLRHKIEPDPRKPVHLLTVYGVGYCLSLPSSSGDPEPDPLPRWTDAFVGRTELCAAVVEELEQSPLLTLQGPGGVGKTRLACEALATFKECNPAATLSWAPILPGADETSIAQAVAAALQVETTEDPRDAVELALSAQPRTLVLDGAEGAAAAVARLASRWAANAGRSRIVVTSRERLAVPMERIVLVPPLDLPSAARLLQERGRAARGGRPWTDDDDPTLLEIATRLDGLPLALELAASRAPILTTAQLQQRLKECFGILVRTVRPTPTRHATLQSTVAWSWELLDARHRRALLRLSVLQGPFPIETAEALVDSEAALPTVSGLVSKSLLQPIDEQGRLRMLDTIRAFVRSRASALPGVEEAALDALAAVAHRVPLSAEDRLAGAAHALHRGLPTALHAALAALRDGTDAAGMLALVEQGRVRLEGDARSTLGVAAVAVLLRHGTAEIVDRWLHALSPEHTDDPDLKAEIHQARGTLLLGFRRSDPQAIEHLTRAASLTEGVERVPVLNQLSRAWMATNDLVRARQVCEEALLLVPRGSLTHAHTLHTMARIVRMADFDLDRSDALFTEALTILRRLDDQVVLGTVLTNLIALRRDQGRLAEALDLSNECAEVARRTGRMRMLAHTSLMGAGLCLLMGHWDASIERYRTTTTLAQRLGNKVLHTLARIGLADIRSLRDGQHDAALADLQLALEDVTTTHLMADIHLARARIAARAGDEPQMCDDVDRMMRWSSEDEAPSQLALLHNHRARLLAHSDPAEAARSLRIAEGHLATLPGRAAGLQCLWHLAAGTLAHHEGRAEETGHHVEAAQSLLDELRLGGESPVSQLVDALRRSSA